MAIFGAYRRLLGNGALTRLLLGEFISSIGDWLYMVALLVLIWQETQDPFTLGIMGAARILPYILLSVPAGIVADRFDRRKVLLITDIVRGGILLVMAAAVALGAPILVIVGLAITATCFSAFFAPAIGAFLPSLVRDESELGPANSAFASLTNLAFFLGPTFAAILLSLGSLPLAFLLDSFTFFFVAGVLWRLPSKKASEAKALATASDKGDQPTTAVKPTEGLFDLLRPVARPFIGLNFLNVVVGVVWGGITVMTVIISVEVYKVDEATGTGLLNSAIGVGGLVGALLAAGLVLRRRQGPPLVIGAIAMGVGLLALGYAPAFWIALVAMAFASAGSLLVDIVTETLLQRIVPDRVRGRALGLVYTVYVAAYAAGSFVIPILAFSQSALVLTVGGIAIAIASVVCLLLLGNFAIQAPAADDPRRLIADVAMFAGLPPARLETAMTKATVKRVAKGDVIIRQGDQADFFYVISAGRVEVTQADADGKSRLLRQMGRTEFFGEIGLLSRIPRTATVTALTDCTLIALDGPAFLQLVEAGPGLTSTLLDVHRGVVSSAGEA
jgi:MFS family permease